MEDESRLSQLANQAVKEICEKFDCVEHILWHGSIVQGKQIRNGTDIDIVLSLDESYGEKTSGEFHANGPIRRLEKLIKIKKKLAAFSHEALDLLGETTTTPLSCLIISKEEVDWDIVKNCDRHDFFSMKSVRALGKGTGDFFSPRVDYACRREVLRSQKGDWEEVASGIQKVQLARKSFCSGGFDSVQTKNECFKELNRSVAKAFEKEQDLNVGFAHLRKKGRFYSDCPAKRFFDENLSLPVRFDYDPSVLMLLWEYTLDMLLEKLNELIPPFDVIFEDYNKKVQQGWLDQWGYARDRKGIFLNKSGEPLLDNDIPITDWSQHHDRIVRDGLNTGSVEFANLFSDKPENFESSDFEEQSDSTTS
ncbi:MAG: hypothetical protein KGQ60_00255 [Planctomycetes bacterium]|nr:hypothetical protein [Planctomycetota bacterium]